TLPAHVEAWRDRTVPLSPETIALLRDRLEGWPGDVTPALATPGSDAAATDAPRVSLSDAMLITLWLNPQLREARAKAGIPAAGAHLADLWPDPQLGFDLMRITQSADHPWLAGVNASFTIPLSGRLEVQQQMALAESAQAAQEAAALEARTLLAV